MRLRSTRQFLPFAFFVVPAVCGLSSWGCGSDPGISSASTEEAQSASGVLTKVAITTLPGASPNAGQLGVFVKSALKPGKSIAPALSNTVVSAVPGAPARPLFVGQKEAFDAVLVAIRGTSGFFRVPAGNNLIVGLDIVPALSGVHGNVNLLVATEKGQTVSAATAVTLFVDPRIHIDAGDLTNHDTANTNIADLFAPFLEGTQGAPAVPVQVLTSHNNNDDESFGIKGLSGPAAAGHREVVWDGVPEVLRNSPNFSAEFFNRLDTGNKGVRGGIVFAATGGTGEEVNDAFNGQVPDNKKVGPPRFDQSPVGGDFSNINPKFAGNLLSITQSAQFVTLGTVTTDIAFAVAGSGAKAVVTGLGIVFSSVDRPNSTSVEYFDENGKSIAKVFAPVKSQGPFPFPGPAVADRFSNSFVGFHDAAVRIAHVRVTAGEIPLDQASDDLPAGPKDVVAFDDVYYAEPRP